MDFCCMHGYRQLRNNETRLLTPKESRVVSSRLLRRAPSRTGSRTYLTLVRLIIRSRDREGWDPLRYAPSALCLHMLSRGMVERLGKRTYSSTIACRITVEGCMLTSTRDHKDHKIQCHVPVALCMDTIS